MLCEVWPAKFHCRCDRPHPFCRLTSEILISKIFGLRSSHLLLDFRTSRVPFCFLAAAFGGVSSLATSLAAVLFASFLRLFAPFLAHYAQLVGEVLFVVVVACLWNKLNTVLTGCNLNTSQRSVFHLVLIYSSGHKSMSARRIFAMRNLRGTCLAKEIHVWQASYAPDASSYDVFAALVGSLHKCRRVWGLRCDLHPACAWFESHFLWHLAMQFLHPLCTIALHL